VLEQLHLRDVKGTFQPGVYADLILLEQIDTRHADSASTSSPSVPRARQVKSSSPTTMRVRTMKGTTNSGAVREQRLD
jgi:hypothetical protein